MSDRHYLIITEVKTNKEVFRKQIIDNNEFFDEQFYKILNIDIQEFFEEGCVYEEVDIITFFIEWLKWIERNKFTIPPFSKFYRGVDDKGDVFRAMYFSNFYVTEPYMVLREIGDYLNLTLKKEGLKEGYEMYLEI